MSPHIRMVWLAAFLAAFPSALPAQDDAPRRGKIDEVEREARTADSDDDDGGSFWLVDIAFDVIKSIFSTPKGPGQGYLPYPWASRRPESFVLEGVTSGRRFGALGITRFDDASSTLGGMAFSLEGAVDMLHYGVEYTAYVEPKATETDRLSTLRAGIGIVPRVGNAGYLHLGAAVRTVYLDGGAGWGGGGDVEMGVRLFPARPLALDAAVRVGGVTWPGGGESFVVESNTGVSLFVGRLEVRGGWHWLRLGAATPFAGPTVGMRVWF